MTATTNWKCVSYKSSVFGAGYAFFRCATILRAKSFLWPPGALCEGGEVGEDLFGVLFWNDFFIYLCDLAFGANKE